MTPDEILKLVGSGGVVALLIIVWWNERSERIQAQKDLLDLAVKQVETNAKLAEMLSGMKETVSQIGGFIQRRRT